MGATYTRQSTYSDGDTITASDTNDEFDQLVVAFAASTGHTHDGTAGEGGPIIACINTSSGIMSFPSPNFLASTISHFHFGFITFIVETMSQAIW